MVWLEDNTIIIVLIHRKILTVQDAHTAKTGGSNLPNMGYLSYTCQHNADKKSPDPFTHLHCCIIMTVFIVLINSHNTALYTWYEFSSEKHTSYLVWLEASATQITHVSLTWSTSFCSVHSSNRFDQVSCTMFFNMSKGHDTTQYIILRHHYYEYHYSPNKVVFQN